MFISFNKLLKECKLLGKTKTLLPVYILRDKVIIKIYYVNI